MSAMQLPNGRAYAAARKARWMPLSLWLMQMTGVMRDVHVGCAGVGSMAG